MRRENTERSAKAFTDERNKLSKTILERLAIGDKTAVSDCINAYGNLIWGMSVDKTHSREAAESAVLDIFRDFWKYADRFDSTKQTEDYFILLLVHRRLIKIENRRRSFMGATV